MKGIKMKALNQFTSLFDSNESEVVTQAVTPTPTANEPYVTSSGAIKIKLTRQQADDLIAGVEQCRQLVIGNSAYNQADLDKWDEFWDGIGNSLRRFHNPHVTIKMLMWCYRSFTKSKNKDLLPVWFNDVVDTLRKYERNLGNV